MDEKMPLVRYKDEYNATMRPDEPWMSFEMWLSEKVATQAAEIERLRKIWKKVEKDMPGEVFVVAFWPDEYFEFDAALQGGDDE